jgi:hypothetical protein
LYVQRRANAMASVGPTPAKCHEPTAMAVARSVIQFIFILMGGFLYHCRLRRKNQGIAWDYERYEMSWVENSLNIKEPQK